DWSSDVCSSDLEARFPGTLVHEREQRLVACADHVVAAGGAQALRFRCCLLHPGEQGALFGQTRFQPCGIAMGRQPDGEHIQDDDERDAAEGERPALARLQAVPPLLQAHEDTSSRSRPWARSPSARADSTSTPSPAAASSRCLSWSMLCRLRAEISRSRPLLRYVMAMICRSGSAASNGPAVCSRLSRPLSLPAPRRSAAS